MTEKFVGPRTDLAVEAREMFIERNPDKKEELDGIIIKEYQEEDVKLTRVKIDEEGSERVGKSAGHYITIESQKLRDLDYKFEKKIATILGAEIERLIKMHDIHPDANCLIVGLGNDYVTPDALGPQALKKAYITQHLFKLQPETVEKGFRPVSAFTPGVMGLTGIETSDLIFGAVKETKPDFIIVIDALAARSVDRVNTTVQLSDTGIHPGSGVGNDRKEVSEKTLEVPVFSIGIPTVVDAVTITADTIDYILKHFGREMREGDQASKALTPVGMTFGERVELTDKDLPDDESKEKYLGVVGSLSEDEKRQLIREVLSPIGHNLMVTPKEVDDVIDHMSKLVASGINQGLHSHIKQENVRDFLN
ncbi:spore protease [Alkalibacillus filiformis]|uniref:Germination protease n=1 Tax=Alkalibacillus filiformis TaxID=200990 RepID=A0ABU0DRK4_9BACI|nr:GPR endopeptidase [Alkalibacillus filiformis]MDQ0351079.1 spore protease [Alkalibacillus filiformis]